MIFNMVGAGGSDVTFTGSEGQFTAAYLPELTLPTKIGTSPMNTTFAPTNRFFYDLMAMTKKLVVPRYFVQSNFGNQSGAFGRTYNCEEIVCESDSITPFTTSGTYAIRSVHIFRAPNVTASFSVGLYPYTEDRIVVDVPRASEFVSCIYGAVESAATSPYTDCSINAPNAAFVGTTSNISSSVTPFRALNGAFTFQSCNTLGNICLPCSGQYSLYLPNLRHISGNNVMAKYKTTDTGSVDLYVGAYLANESWATKTLENLSSPMVLFHIPAGESETKATLDAKGIPYIQDYEEV